MKIESQRKNQRIKINGLRQPNAKFKKRHVIKEIRKIPRIEVHVFLD